MELKIPKWADSIFKTLFKESFDSAVKSKTVNSFFNMSKVKLVMSMKKGFCNDSEVLSRGSVVQAIECEVPADIWCIETPSVLLNLTLTGRTIGE